jgi:dephospho-CoA kinase
VIEIPLLKDKLSYPYLNRILVVQASHEQQISRFMARDNSSKDDALAILAVQTDLTKQKALADDLILNTGTLKELKKNVQDLHKKYMELSSLSGSA